MSSLNAFLKLLNSSQPAFAQEQDGAVRPPQREELVGVSAPPPAEAFVFDSESAPKSPAAKFGKDNYNSAIQERAIDLLQVERDRDMAVKNFNESRGNLSQAYSDINMSGPSRVSPYSARILKASDDYELSKDQKVTPDYLSTAILALGPALLGYGLGGGSAAKATADYTIPLATAAMAEKKKELVAERERHLKAVTYLIQAEKLDVESFSAGSKSRLDRAKAVLDATKDIAGMDERQLKEASKAIEEISKDISKLRADGTKSIMNTEIDQNRIEQSQKNSEITAGLRDKEINLKEKLAKDKASAKVLENKNNPNKNFGLKLSTSLRKEYQSRPIVKDFNIIKTSYENVRIMAAKPSAAGDISLIFNYMRMLDPTSTVRETEYATAAQAGGIPDKIVGQYNTLISGQRLSVGMRADFVSKSKALMDTKKGQLLEVQKEFDFLAKNSKVDSNLVYQKQQEPAAPPASSKMTREQKIKLLKEKGLN